MFDIYKKGQGKWTRGCTMAGALIIVALGAQYLWSHVFAGWTRGYWLPAKGLTVALFILGGLYLAFYVSYVREGTGNFFIATEGEMKKVSWSSTQEIIGSTKVVVFTLLAMGVLLFAVDLMFMILFSHLGVLKAIDLRAMFGLQPATKTLSGLTRLLAGLAGGL